MLKIYAPVIATALVLSSFLATPPVCAEDMPQSRADLVASVMPTFVDIAARGVRPPDPNAKTDDASAIPTIKDEVGSGIIIDADGLILTNRHVIEGAYSIFVTLNDGSVLRAKLVAKALNFDVALLKVEAGRPLQAARLGDSDAVRIGDPVLAIGNPWGFAGSASSGIVSALHRSIGLSAYDDLIQTDATINQGNSGGPLFDGQGRVIGINQAIYTRDGGGSIGIGFAIPINAARFLLDDAKRFGTPRIGWLGIAGQTVTPAMASALRRPRAGGIIVASIDKLGSVAGTDLRVGDLIVGAGDEDFSDMPALNRFVARSVDQAVTLRVWRGQQDFTVATTIKRFPQDFWSKIEPAPPAIRDLGDLGAALKDVSGTTGAVVSSVADKSLAWAAGLQAGDIIQRTQGVPIASVADAETLFVKLHGEGVTNVLIFVDGPNGPRWIDLAVGR